MDSSSNSGLSLTSEYDESSSENEEPLESSEQVPFEFSRQRHSIGARIQANTLLEIGIPHWDIKAKTGISKSQVYRLRNKAINRGWDPKISGIAEVHHVEDTPRSRRPQISQEIVDLILKTVTQNSTTQGWSCSRIAYEVSLVLKESQAVIKEVSGVTVWRILRQNMYFSYKRTVKPGLKLEDKEVRLKWCMDHKDRKLEDWKNVIWTNETSVQLGSVRGKRRVWRRSNEAFHPHVITRRWKGFSELMWWSAFSYDKKGPFHIWEDETKEEKEACLKDLATRNAAKYENDKALWEIENRIRRLQATSIVPGRKPVFKHDESTRAYILREGKGGINWYWYQKVILEPLLLPFAKECLHERPNTLVQEDGAPSHASRYQQEVFDIWEISRLLWPPNSPDLNMIEPCWFWMKRHTTKCYGHQLSVTPGRAGNTMVP